jgi:hypothetical protein
MGELLWAVGFRLGLLAGCALGGALLRALGAAERRPTRWRGSLRLVARSGEGEG